MNVICNNLDMCWLSYCLNLLGWDQGDRDFWAFSLMSLIGSFCEIRNSFKVFVWRICLRDVPCLSESKAKGALKLRC